MTPDSPQKDEPTATPLPIANAVVSSVKRPAEDRVKPESEPPGVVVKTLYWLVWFVAVPGLLAAGLLWGILPAADSPSLGILTGLANFAHEQAVPAWIVAFTLFEMVVWGLRYHLPFAEYAYPPPRRDLPANMRGPFERARALMDELATLRGKHANDVGETQSRSELGKVDAAVTRLETAMSAVPFDAETFQDALYHLDGEVEAKLGRYRKSEVREYTEAIVVAVVVAFGLRFFVIEAFKIPSGSMIPTLQVGDHIFVNKFSYGPAIPFSKKRIWDGMPPHRGDVMVFAFPEKPEQDFIKRVIAIPGDVLETRNGHPVINGWRIPSCSVGTYSYSDGDSTFGAHSGELFVEYLDEQSYLTFYESGGGYREHEGPFYAKPGEVWVMGDNRNNSLDSRAWYNRQGGGVPFENIRGRALFVWLAVGDKGMDFTRFGTAVMGRPRLPLAMKGLEPALEKCFANRPPLSETTPPRPVK